MTSHKSFEQDPRAAVLVYHIQSGLLREFEAPNNDMNGLFEDVDEAKEEECLLTAVENFNKGIGQDEEYVGCASCGIICRSSLCDKIQLGNHALDHLVLCAEFTKRWKKLQPVFRAAHNVTEFSNNRLYATAYTLIDQKDNTGYFCKKCQIPESFLPNHTRFIDFDYGVSYVRTST